MLRAEVPVRFRCGRRKFLRKANKEKEHRNVREAFEGRKMGSSGGDDAGPMVWAAIRTDRHQERGRRYQVRSAGPVLGGLDAKFGHRRLRTKFVLAAWPLDVWRRYWR